MRVVGFLRILNGGIGPGGVIGPAVGDITGDQAIVAGERDIGAFETGID